MLLYTILQQLKLPEALDGMASGGNSAKLVFLIKCFPSGAAFRRILRLGFDFSLEGSDDCLFPDVTHTVIRSVRRVDPMTAM